MATYVAKTLREKAQIAEQPSTQQKPTCSAKYSQ
jgi:hypothetical protein